MQLPQRTVSHRANLFSAICQIASNESTPVARVLTLPAQKRVPEHEMIKSRRLPLIMGKSIIFGTRTLDLSGSPMTLELYKSFIEAAGHRVSKYDLAARVYGIENPKSRSDRSWNATKLNITKMISRSRKQAAATLSPDNNKQIAWFSYNPVEEVWELYSIRGDSFPKWAD